MAKTIQTAIEAGSRMAPAKFYIKITPDGPYLLYGNPPMDQEIIVPNDEGSSWTYIGPRRTFVIRNYNLLIHRRITIKQIRAVRRNLYIEFRGSHTRTGFDSSLNCFCHNQIVFYSYS